MGRPLQYVVLRDMAVRALREAVDAYHNADDKALGRAIAKGEGVLAELDPYGEVFIEPTPNVVAAARSVA